MYNFCCKSHYQNNERNQLIVFEGFNCGILYLESGDDCIQKHTIFVALFDCSF
jgi:hypothetical protein